jgi:hypothetical protein
MGACPFAVHLEPPRFLTGPSPARRILKALVDNCVAFAGYGCRLPPRGLDATHSVAAENKAPAACFYIFRQAATWTRRALSPPATPRAGSLCERPPALLGAICAAFALPSIDIRPAPLDSRSARWVWR